MSVRRSHYGKEPIMRRHIPSIAAIVAFFFGGLFFPYGQSAAYADGAANNGHIINDPNSARALTICKSWTGTAADPNCTNGTDYWDLAKGKKSWTGNNSPGWTDTDGAYVPYKCTGVVRYYWGPAGDPNGTSRKLNVGWNKIGGTPGGNDVIKISC